jgi:single-strand DNA-binding protein
MGTSLNKVMLIGRLGKEPEVRAVGETHVANFSIAVDETYKDRNGDKQKKTEWVNIVVWGNSVQNFIQPYIHKGDLVYVEGKLQTRSWEKDGVTKYTTEVNVTDIKGLVTNSDPAPAQNSRPAGNSRPAQRPANTAARPVQRPAPAGPAFADDDIGF